MNEKCIICGSCEGYFVDPPDDFDECCDDILVCEKCFDKVQEVVKEQLEECSKKGSTLLFKNDILSKVRGDKDV